MLTRFHVQETENHQVVDVTKDYEVIDLSCWNNSYCSCINQNSQFYAAYILPL